MPSSTDITYVLTRNIDSPLVLVDYDGVVAALESSQRGIARMVAEAPYYADWSLQHNPKPSQMIGEWLRAAFASQADGLYFSSTKNPAGKNVLIFADGSHSLHPTHTAIPLKE